MNAEARFLSYVEGKIALFGKWGKSSLKAKLVPARRHKEKKGEYRTGHRQQSKIHRAFFFTIWYGGVKNKNS